MARSKKGDKDIGPDKPTDAQAEEGKAIKRNARRSFLKGAGGLAAAAAMAPLLKAQESASENITMEMPLDAEKIEAIQKCIANGTLRMTVSKINLQQGGNTRTKPWLYD